MPPPLAFAGFGFFGMACFLPLPIAMPLPALSLYTKSPITT